MRKGISTIIASILILMITLALTGTAYLYISDTFTGKISTSFELIDSVNDTVTIRNSGINPITSFSRVKVDGSDAVYRASKQDNSLVGYWKMDENYWVNDCATNAVIDSSGNNNGKSCPAGTGPIGGATGEFGNAGSFDGVNNYVGITNVASLNFGATTNFTISVWLKPQIFTSGSGNEFVFKGDAAGSIKGYSLGWLSDGRARFIISSNIIGGSENVQFGGTTVMQSGRWYHVVGVADRGSIARIYVNGQQENTADISSVGNIDVIGSNLILGSLAGGYWFFDGTIDEVKIYNRSLSNQEIKSEYNLGSQINPGEITTIKIYNQLSAGTHNLKICTSSICNTAFLTIH